MKYPGVETAATVYTSATLDYAFARPAAGYLNGAGIGGGTTLPPAPFDCPQCTNATHFLWGIATTVIDWPKFVPLSYLLNLDGKGIRYRLTRKGVAERGEPEVYHIAGTNATIIDSVAIDFDVLGSDWRLEAIPLAGWYPVWLEPLYLVVVVAAILASASALLILKARWQHYHLLLRMLPKRVISRLHAQGGLIVERFESVTMLFSESWSIRAWRRGWSRSRSW